mmetsp:Transcript_7656/g.18923  ORF Transcript_7656/g.18923 Transcript_7656/m.18923 type:complete len:167 (-) Transcript_7656:1816-2316(-)
MYVPPVSPVAPSHARRNASLSAHGPQCCKSQRIYLCDKPWVGCREVAYELSHALNVCRGRVSCAPHGVQVDGADCGYFSPPDVACSELRAAHWTGRCDREQLRRDEDSKQRCLEWHARWAVASCFPQDKHLEAHVRWARTKCSPTQDDCDLTKHLGNYMEQFFRFD